MKIGNVTYNGKKDIPKTIGLFPLEEALVLPTGYLSLNVFEKRYLELINDSIKGERIIGIIQIRTDKDLNGKASKKLDILATSKQQLYKTGCMARIVSYTETGDNRLIISLQGICRFDLIEEIPSTGLYRIFKIEPWIDDLIEEQGLSEQERIALMEAFADFFEANDLETDWEHAMETPSRTLVNALAISSPFNTAEKQALLEAETTRQRAQTLIALAERSMLAQGGIKANDLQ